jgi:hypothetical protein
MSFDGLLNQTVRLLRRTSTPDAYGLNVTVDAEVYGELRCRIEALTGSSARRVEGREVDATHRLFCHRGIEIREGDVVQHYDGYHERTLRVLFVDHDTAAAGNHIEVLLAEPEHTTTGAGS